MRLRSQFFIAIISSLLLFLFSGCGPSLPTSAGGATGGGSASIPTPPVASATAGNTQNTITWPTVTGATSYNIYWTNNPAASTAVRTSGTKIPNVTSPYNHIGLTNSSTYYYVVTAANSVGESNSSNTVATMPLASLPLAIPASLSAIAISTTSAAQINLNWTAAGGATSYNIYSSIAPNPAITPANLVAITASTSFSHTALTTNTTYYYKVTAIINASESNPSNTASATTPPLIPTVLVATASGTRQINLSWSPAIGATSYNIYYSTTSNPVTKTNGTLLSNVVGTSYNHINLTPGTTYYYSIAAIGMPSTNLSDNTTTVNAKTLSLVIMGGAVQGNLTLTGLVSTIVTSTSGLLNNPCGITTDGINYFILDSSNQVIRKVNITTGTTTILTGVVGLNGSSDGVPGISKFWTPNGITTDGINIYVADTSNNNIRKIDFLGNVTTVAGISSYPFSPPLVSYVDGIGVSARFNQPVSITTDGTNLYVADTGNNVIRKVAIATGVVTTIAGASTSGGFIDGSGATVALFNSPHGITTDGTNLYITDTGNNAIRKIVIATGMVTTIATGFTGLWGITTDGINLYITDGNMIRKVDKNTGVVTTIAGSITGGALDGLGTAAQFNFPRGITTDGISLYVSEYSPNNTIRKIQ